MLNLTLSIVKKSLIFLIGVILTLFFIQKTLLASTLSKTNNTKYLPPKKVNSINIMFRKAVDDDFLEYNLSKNQKDLISVLREKNQNLNSKSDLFEILKKAKKFEINKEFKLAYENYLIISNKQYNVHWNKQKKEIITFSLLKLAELDLLKQSFWLKKAIAFNSQSHTLLKYFNSGVKREFHFLRKNMKKVHLIPHPDLYNFKEIWINGELITLSQLSLYPFYEDQVYKISLYSNKYEPFDKVISFNELKNTQFNSISLISRIDESCSNFEINPNLNLNTKKLITNSYIFVFNNINCILSKDFTSKVLTQTGSDLTNSPSNSMMFFNSSKGKSKKRYSLLKNKWLWLTVSAFIGYKIYEHNNKPKKRYVYSKTSTTPSANNNHPVKPHTPTQAPKTPNNDKNENQVEEI